MGVWIHCCCLLYSVFFTRHRVATGSHGCVENACCDTARRCLVVTQPGPVLLLCHAPVVSVWSEVQIVGAFPSFLDMGLKIVGQVYSEWVRYQVVRFQKVEWLLYVLFRMLCTVEAFLQYFWRFQPLFPSLRRMSLLAPIALYKMGWILLQQPQF